MDKEEYEKCQDSLLILSGGIGLLPLEEMLEAINKAESIGPIIDPMLFKQGSMNLEKIKHIAQVALKLKNTVREEGLIPND